MTYFLGQMPYIARKCLQKTSKFYVICSIRKMQLLNKLFGTSLLHDDYEIRYSKYFTAFASKQNHFLRT